MRTPGVKLDRPQSQSKKLTIAEKRLIIKKAEELRPSIKSWDSDEMSILEMLMKN